MNREPSSGRLLSNGKGTTGASVTSIQRGSGQAVKVDWAGGLRNPEEDKLLLAGVGAQQGFASLSPACS